MTAAPTTRRSAASSTISSSWSGVTWRAFADLAEKNWRRHIDLNLVSNLAATSTALPHLIASGSGAIINVTSIEGTRAAPGYAAGDVLARADVLSGLLFIALAAIGLWISRDYPVGTALRMGTGYVPRLLCWILLGLGVLVMLQGLRDRSRGGQLDETPPVWRSIVFITASLLVFAFAIQPLGVVIAIALLTLVGSFAGREGRPLEIASTTVMLIAITLVIFVWGVGLPIPVWPEL